MQSYGKVRMSPIIQVHVTNEHVYALRSRQPWENTTKSPPEMKLHFTDEACRVPA